MHFHLICCIPHLHSAPHISETLQKKQDLWFFLNAICSLHIFTLGPRMISAMETSVSYRIKAINQMSIKCRGLLHFPTNSCKKTLTP